MTEYPKMVYGFHGCDIYVKEHILNGGHWRFSNNSYDWLGSGIYFWENDEKRAYEWAKMLSLQNDKIKEPAVIGAKIDLGRCLDITTLEGIEMVKDGYKYLQRYIKGAGIEMPKNKSAKNDDEWKLRYLDRAVIETIHVHNVDKSFDTVRGAFTEGKKISPGAGFKDLTHIQIAVRNEAKILEVF